MNPYIIYHSLYLLLVTIFTLIVANNYSRFQTWDDKIKGTGGVVLCLFLIWFIGTRPTNNFTDTANYALHYKMIRGKFFSFSLDAPNFIFDNLLEWFAANEISFERFILIMSSIYFGAMLVAMKKVFPKTYYLAFLVYLGAFSTFSYSSNGFKAGAAASVFLLALAYRNNKIICVLLALVSLGIHHSMSMVIAALICSFLYKNTKNYFYIWAVCVVISALHIEFFQSLFASFADESGASYLTAKKGDDYTHLTGFRLDFILYSAAPVAVGYWLLFKRQVANADYEMWLRMYLLTNSVWMLCMYANYSNRIAYLSWFMYPVVLIYPFIGFYWSDKQNDYAKKTALYHLGFTLFMDIIYYGL